MQDEDQNASYSFQLEELSKLKRAADEDNEILASVGQAARQVVFFELELSWRNPDGKFHLAPDTVIWVPVLNKWGLPGQMIRLPFYVTREFLISVAQEFCIKKQNEPKQG